MSDELGLEQADCEMHILSLLIAYVLGVKENTQTTWVPDVSMTGGKKKVTQVVTPGGEFSEERRIMTVGKEIGNFWTKSGQRKQDLQDARAFLILNISDNCHEKPSRHPSCWCTHHVHYFVSK